MPPNPALAPRIERVPPEVILPLRASILRPGRPVEAARFPEDQRPGVAHWAGWLADGPTTPQACLTLLPSTWEDLPAWQLRGMASAQAARGKGLALALLQAATEWALQQEPSAEILWCNAREVAVGFYARAGWVVVSDVFEVPEIGPHFRMVWRR